MIDRANSEGCPIAPADLGADGLGDTEVVAFLRAWLPPDAKREYREMIRLSPDDWYRDPHFTAGDLVEKIFVGNGITPKALGVDSLEGVWWRLLARAVLECDAEG